MSAEKYRNALERIAAIKPDQRPISPQDNFDRAVKAVKIAREALARVKP